MARLGDPKPSLTVDFPPSFPLKSYTSHFTYNSIVPPVNDPERCLDYHTFARRTNTFFFFFESEFVFRSAYN